MRRRKWPALILLLPLLLVMGVFLTGLIGGILQGFGYIPAFGLRQFTLEHYASALSDPGLPMSAGISLYVAAAAAAAATALAVLTCFALVTLKKDKGVLAAIIRIPMFIPWIVTGLMMIHMLSGGGWLARLCTALGISAAAFENLLYSPSHLGIIIAFVWACTPFACYMVQSVMAQVTDSLGEAAANLGAGLWRRLFHVTLPICAPAIGNTFLILLLSCFGIYEIPALLGMTMPRALPVEIYYQYLNSGLSHRPYAMALNAVMLALALGMAGIVTALRRRRERRAG